MSNLQSINPDELVLIAFLLGITPIKSHNPDELNVLGNFLVAIGGIILTAAAQQQYLISQKQNDKQDMQKQIEELRLQIQQLIDQHI